MKNASKTTETDLNEIVGQDSIIARAFDEISAFNWNEAELRTYDLVDMHRISARAILEGAEAKGRAEGKTEANIETATKLLKLGLDKSLIGTAIGISLEGLEELKKELGF
ncbi:MAG: hypothetical protein WCK49_09820 [Myxococcaceae bacterium]